LFSRFLKGNFISASAVLPNGGIRFQLVPFTFFSVRLPSLREWYDICSTGSDYMLSDSIYPGKKEKFSTALSEIA
jgi:hypothetical protein